MKQIEEMRFCQIRLGIFFESCPNIIDMGIKIVEKVDLKKKSGIRFEKRLSIGLKTAAEDTTLA